MNILFNILYLLPKNHISRVVGWILHRKWPLHFHTFLKTRFVRYFNINMAEAQKPIEAYQTFGELFVRKLRENVRPLSNAPIISPVDGIRTQLGSISETPLRLNQIKQKTYNFLEFTNGVWPESQFARGWYSTIYLSPQHYHRIHAPMNGLVTKVLHIPGRLWPVNNWSVRNISSLFVKNERVILEIQNGESVLLLAMVGATNVGKIHLTFLPGFNTNHPERCHPNLVMPLGIEIKKGDEIGFFSLGSTIVMIGNEKAGTYGDLYKSPAPEQEQSGHPIKMGASLFL